MAWQHQRAVPRRSHDPRAFNSFPKPRIEAAHRASRLDLCRVKRLIRPVGAPFQRDRNLSTRCSTSHARRHS